MVYISLNELIKHYGAVKIKSTHRHTHGQRRDLWYFCTERLEEITPSWMKMLLQALPFGCLAVNATVDNLCQPWK